MTTRKNRNGIYWSPVMESTTSRAQVNSLLFLAIKRKIDIEKIKAVTVSKIGTEFIIHVPEEYDYRFVLEYADTRRLIEGIRSSTSSLRRSESPQDRNYRFTIGKN